MTGAAKEAGELVEQARADPDELIFGPPQRLRQFHAEQVVLRLPSKSRLDRPGSRPSWIKNQATEA